MEIIKFTKMVATGNDFILIDNRKKLLKNKNTDLIKKLCNRHYSIGADGLILLENSRIADFKMRFFNLDGKEAEMCGNGSRCLALFAQKLGIVGGKMSFETKAGIISATIKKNMVKIKLSQPKEIKLNISFKIKKKKIFGHFINTGVPHFVIPTDNLKTVDVISLGRAIRFHSYFQPDGVNVDFIKIEKKTIYVRTYERGVEDETLSCGTGIVASGVVTHLTTGLKSPITVKTKNQEILKVYLTKDGNNIVEAYLEGTAEITYEGKVKKQ